jgi:hypothetical protein
MQGFKRAFVQGYEMALEEFENVFSGKERK